LHPTAVSQEDRMMICLVQSILADPEIIIFDKPLLHEHMHESVLSALVAWQMGGPQAVLDLSVLPVSQPPVASNNDLNSCPDWMDFQGKIKRTLVLNAHKNLGLEEKISQFAVAVPLQLDKGRLTIGSASRPGSKQVAENGNSTTSTQSTSGSLAEAAQDKVPSDIKILNLGAGDDVQGLFDEDKNGSKVWKGYVTI